MARKSDKLAAACTAANRDVRLNREVEDWQLIDDILVPELRVHEPRESLKSVKRRMKRK